MFNFEKLETWQKTILSEADFEVIYAAVEELGKMLSGLRRSVLEGA
jgi:hypothetical protein